MWTVCPSRAPNWSIKYVYVYVQVCTLNQVVNYPYLNVRHILEAIVYWLLYNKENFTSGENFNRENKRSKTDRNEAY